MLFVAGIAVQMINFDATARSAFDVHVASTSVHLLQDGGFGGWRQSISEAPDVTDEAGADAAARPHPCLRRAFRNSAIWPRGPRA
jgi:hypothetical protein